jgi:hypothetical protein
MSARGDATTRGKQSSKRAAFGRSMARTMRTHRCPYWRVCSSSSPKACRAPPRFKIALNTLDDHWETAYHVLSSLNMDLAHTGASVAMGRLEAMRIPTTNSSSPLALRLLLGLADHTAARAERMSDYSSDDVSRSLSVPIWRGHRMRCILGASSGASSANCTLDPTASAQSAAPYRPT